jgi:DNA-binding transcriptional LysR family regulator
MELFEVRYFLAVARSENIHRASERLNVSPGSLSKAVSRIEGELGVKLFSREGRNIRLTEAGRLLRSRASDLVTLEESIRAEVAGGPGALTAVIAGPEILLSHLGPEISARIRKRNPRASFEFQACDDGTALKRIETGEAHLALVTADVPAALATRQLEETRFLTVVGRGHPLHARARAKKTVTVEDALEHEFVSPTHPIFGRVGQKQSLDGWRDDEFPRRIGFTSTCLSLITRLVSQGRALAYLPDYLVTGLDGVEPLKISGCPYTCVQRIKLVARRPKDTAWIDELF